MHLDKELSDKTYNMVLGATVIYGLSLNLLAALSLGPVFRTWSYGTLFILWLVFVGGGLLLMQIDYFWTRVAAFHLIVAPFGPILSAVLGMYSSKQVILTLILTVIITAIMTVLSGLFPRFFSRLIGVLPLALALSLGVCFLSYQLGMSISTPAMICVVIFSAHFGYDWYHAQHCKKTLGNAIVLAIDFYLDIIHIFLEILQMLTSDDSGDD